ncbi:MAG: hypothetical protein V4506_00700 [Bacteroidota bacterium]
MKTNFSISKEENTGSIKDSEKSELMQLFEDEIRNPYHAQIDLINAILEQE